MATIRVLCPAGERVLDVLRRRGTVLPSFCSGSGICGRCRIRIIGEALPVTQADRACLTKRELADGWRLACRAVPAVPVQVEVSVPDALPAHICTAQRQAAQGHRYGLAVSGDAAALVDLTARTVLDAVYHSPAQALLAAHPEAEKGLVRTITQDPGSDVQAALEEAIMALFRDA